MSNIEANLDKIHKNISAAALKSGKTYKDITLVAVTKTVPKAVISSLARLGVKTLGENRVQEFLSKYENNDGFNWHIIGNLQRNKVKYIIDKVSMVQSVNSIELASAIDTAAKNHSLIMEILLEINIANEPTKHGINPSQALEFALKLGNLSNIRLRGLMAIPPFTDNAELNREYFKKMFKIYIDICKKIGDNHFNVLSMGMTGDYAVAVEEGSTMVRIGTGIFNS